MARDRSLVLVAHNVRSTHNVGSLLRTADGLGVTGVFLTGYTPYPPVADDDRLPHIQNKINSQVHKTALGAEHSVQWHRTADIQGVIKTLHNQGFVVAGLEQDEESTSLPDYKPPEKVALIVGREVEGLEDDIKQLCDLLLEIPMLGKKESFNVAQAAAIGLYHLTYC